MTTPTITIPNPAATSRRAPLLPALWELVKAELRRMFRNPMFTVGTIGFPLMFFGLFGLPNAKAVTDGGVNVGQIILIQFAVYSLLSLAMFSFGAAIALQRTDGWLRLLRASPLPIPLFFTAKVLGAMLFSLVALAALYVFAHFAGGITLPLGVALLVTGKLLLCMIPLIALGLCIGFLVSPQAAQIFANIVSVIMSFASGLFTPLDQMPKFVQDIAPLMPAYHVGQVGLSALYLNALYPDGRAEMQHWLILAAFTLVFGALAVWGMKKDESREG